jgi:hypothetical protein
MFAKNQETDLSAYTPAYRLLEEARKSWDYVVCDKLVHVLNVPEVASDFLIRIAENYLKIWHSWIECRLTFEREWNLQYLVIIEAAVNESRRNRVPKYNSRRTVNCDAGMFVDITEQVQTPKMMTLHHVCIPTVVRLKRIDDRDSGGGNPSCLPSKSLLCLDVPRIENRKLSHRRIRHGQLRERPNKMVEGCSQVIEKIPGDKMDVVRSWDNLNPNDMHLIYNIVLTQESAGFRFVENSKLIPEVFQMFLRPFCLEKGVGQTHGN